jgi:hypothetical protein
MKKKYLNFSTLSGAYVAVAGAFLGVDLADHWRIILSLGCVFIGTMQALNLTKR